mmetsp:Transcript_60720/g.107816  ORF Transcript_60720/g.107816 Transcript_60720/m.107816 type:complete len:155 (+) Transcript_60720:377-841(+)
MKIKKDVVALVYERFIHIHEVATLKGILILAGLCVLSEACDPWLLCCSGQSEGSKVQTGPANSHGFRTHDTGLAALVLQSVLHESARRVATASIQIDESMLYRLRRGLRPTSIFCLAFRSDCVAVASGTALDMVKVEAELQPRGFCHFESILEF